MKKKLLCTLIAILCVSSLVACGKKDEEVDDGKDHHNYAINETKDNKDEVEGRDFNEPASYYYEQGKEYTDGIVDQDTTEHVSEEGITYGYPQNNKELFSVDLFTFGEVCTYNFILNDIVVQNDKDGSNSINEHIYCTSYVHPFTAEDTDYSTITRGNYSLVNLDTVLDYIQVGNHKCSSIKELLSPTDKFEQMIKSYEDEYDVVFVNENEIDRQETTESDEEIGEEPVVIDHTNTNKDYNKNDIFSFASMEYTINEFSGKSYDWTFSLNTFEKEYTSEERETMTKTPNHKVCIHADYDRFGEIVQYTYTLILTPHYWNEEYIDIRPIYEYSVDENGELLKEKVGEEEVNTGQFNTTTNGFDFTYAHMKLKDGSYVGLNNFTVIVHNPENSLNNKLNIEYNFE